MNKNKIVYGIIGAVIGIASFVLAWHWYDWKLALIIFIALLGNNIENKAK